MSLADDLKEFEEQIRLQNCPVTTSNSTRTRVDPDGTVMEWDEKRKAWFAKIDDDFIACYQMSYGSDIAQASSSTKENYTDETEPVDWTDFNAKLAKLREEKGDSSEEVQQLTKAAQESLRAYYNSPAYREWYNAYCKQQATVSTQLDTADRSASKSNQKGTKPRYDLKPAERMRSLLDAGGEDPDEALARAEAELQAGVPLLSGPPESQNSMSSSGALEETDQRSTQLADQADSAVPTVDNTTNTGKPPATKRKQAAPPPAWYEIDDNKNTHVYVTGLPPTMTQQEFHDLMSKYGVIMNEPFTNKPRVKLYTDESGKPKGDGRCCYVKVESVELVLRILDGMIYAPGYTLRVERAKFQPKGEFDPKKRRRLTLKEKKKLKEQQESLFRWGIDTSKFVRGKKERVLVLKNAFVETDFLRDVTLIPVVRELIRVQCAKCGTIKKITVHDANPLGVVTVTFSTAEEADTALAFLNGALFNYPGSGGARQLQVERWDGKTNYSVKEDKNEEQSRLTNWVEFLGGEASSEEEEEEDSGTCDQDKNISSKTGPSLSCNAPDKHDLSSEFGDYRTQKVELAPDYWETSSPERVDTDDELEAGGSSGNETA